MPFESQNPAHKQMLVDALKWSRNQMKPYNARAKEGWEIYVGSQYGQDDEKDDYLPLMSQVVDTFLDRLAGNAPRGSWNPATDSEHARYIRPTAKKLQYSPTANTLNNEAMTASALEVILKQNAPAPVPAAADTTAAGHGEGTHETNKH